ncbi:MAG: dihydrodipicolinate reductase C-terminal domain-containing protein, partial [Mucinivorans sp.]
MKVALLGYGKMGHEIEKILISRGHEIVLVIDKDNANDLTAVNLKKADVAIEFSTPITAFNNIIASLEAGVRVVCGTTAWIEKLPEVVEVCKKNNGAFFYASNYSVGVNLFFKINASLAKLMNRFTEYDVTLNEVHHTQKKDAPSGTAITLAEGILSGCKRKKEWYLGATTQADILEVTAQRRSVVPGTH